MIRRQQSHYANYKRNKNRNRKDVNKNTQSPLAIDVDFRKKKKSIAPKVILRDVSYHSSGWPNRPTFDGKLGEPDEPWLPKSVITFLDQWLTKDKLVLEYGSGASSIWLATRVKHVTSIEHKKTWHSLVLSQAQKAGIKNLSVKLLKGIQDNYRSYVGAGKKLGKFDLIVVDGRERVRVIFNTHLLLKAGGLLLLDNSDRKYYKKAIDMLNKMGWKKTIYSVPHVCSTTIWEKPKG